jgi:hypothetical protein
MQQDAQARNKPDSTYSQQISVKDLYKFLAVTVQIGHDHKPTMKLCCTIGELYHIPFYSSVMPHDHFLTILKYLHFAESQNPPTQNREDPDYDRLWKIIQIFGILNSKFSELYHPTEHMAVDELIVKFKTKVMFWQHI